MKDKNKFFEESKLVSIGIPTYNRPEDLEKCVKNLLNQTYPNIEIIISDNNSNNLKNKLLYKSNLFKNPKMLIHNVGWYNLSLSPWGLLRMIIIKKWHVP